LGSSSTIRILGLIFKKVTSTLRKEKPDIRDQISDEKNLPAIEEGKRD